MDSQNRNLELERFLFHLLRDTQKHKLVWTNIDRGIWSTSHQGVSFTGTMLEGGIISLKVKHADVTIRFYSVTLPHAAQDLLKQLFVELDPIYTDLIPAINAYNQCLQGEFHVILFISGHLDLTEDEFAAHYAPTLTEAMASGASFVVGDARGADLMAQTFLNGHSVRVFHMFDTPRHNMDPSNATLGGFTSDAERDAAMTLASTHDLAWVRPGRENSGTARNLKRRAHGPSVKDVQYAWKASVAAGGAEFYNQFEIRTRMTQQELTNHFAAWNKLTHETAEEIALSHGVTIQDGGFQAYLTDIFKMGRPRIEALCDIGPALDPNPRSDKTWPMAEDCPTCDGRTGVHKWHRFGCANRGV